MLTLDELRTYGANVDAGLARCFNKEDFYLRLVNIGLSDPNFDRLAAAMASGDARGAFEAAHGLKGSTGNLSLTPLSEPLIEMTDRLRDGGTVEDVAELYARIVAALDRARRLMEP